MTAPMPVSFRLKKPLGPNHVVDPDDTVHTKFALAGLGFFEPPEEGITPWPDTPMVDAVAAFQRDNGLKVDGVIKPGGETEQAKNAALATGSDLGDIPGTGPTRPRIGVEAVDPAYGGRAPAEVDPNIGVGPLFRIPDEPPKADSDAKKPAGEHGFRQRSIRNAKDLFEWFGNTKGKVVIDRPEGGWMLGWLFDDSEPLILTPEDAQLIVDMGEYSDRDQGISPEEERELHRRASKVLKGNRTALLEFHRRIGDLRDGPISDSEFDSLMRVASEEWFWQDGSFNSGMQSGMPLEFGR